jgi:outer membrane protein OmpA-like peptidoglycan-associated protein
MSTRGRCAAIAAFLLLATSSCSGSDDERTGEDPDAPSDTSSPAPGTGTSTRPGSGATADPALPDEIVGAECRPREGRRVRQLEDVVIPAVVVEQVVDDEGNTLMAGFTIPAQLVDAGCVIRFDSPGGCLGAVRITDATIPAATIPESRAGDQVFASVTAATVVGEGDRAPRVCQVEQDGELPTVSRPGVVRAGFSRDGVARPGGSVDGTPVPTVRLPPVRLPDVDIDPGRLERRTLSGSDVGVISGDGRTSYVAPSVALFDFDRAEIRPDAEESLQQIVRSIRRDAPGEPLLVEGHTDDIGSARYAIDLSRRRAEAVAEWLVVRGGIDRALITTKGLGETAPTVPNTSEANRQRNRRVVITVQSG